MAEFAMKEQKAIAEKNAKKKNNISDFQAKNEALSDPQYKKSQMDYLTAKLDSDLLEVVTKSLDNKKSMIRVKHERILARLSPDAGRRVLEEKMDYYKRKQIETDAIKEQLRKKRMIKLKGL